MEIDWNKVMDIGGRLAELDLVVFVRPHLSSCFVTGHYDENYEDPDREQLQVIEFKVDKSSVSDDRKMLYLDPTTMNFLFPDGMVVEAKTLLNSGYTEICRWVGLK